MFYQLCKADLITPIWWEGMPLPYVMYRIGSILSSLPNSAKILLKLNTSEIQVPNQRSLVFGNKKIRRQLFKFSILITSAYTADNPVPNVSAKKSQNIGSKNSAKASFPYVFMLIIIHKHLNHS